jgi:hypothetical protein
MSTDSNGDQGQIKEHGIENPVEKCESSVLEITTESDHYLCEKCHCETEEVSISNEAGGMKIDNQSATKSSVDSPDCDRDTIHPHLTVVSSLVGGEKSSEQECINTETGGPAKSVFGVLNDCGAVNGNVKDSHQEPSQRAQERFKTSTAYVQGETTSGSGMCLQQSIIVPWSKVYEKPSIPPKPSKPPIPPKPHIILTHGFQL